MSTPTPRRRRSSAHSPARVRTGAHRGGGGVLGALVPSALAVASVASLITALAVWQGEATDQPRAAAATADETPATTSAATSEPPAPTDEAPSATAGPSSPTASSPTASSPQPSDTTTVRSMRSGMEVVVLNQTSRGGLAGTVADRLRAAGWVVPAVGNFRGVVPATTVYHPGGSEAEALVVAADLPTEPRVRPRFGNLSTTRLTVVVTDSYPG